MELRDLIWGVLRRSPERTPIRRTPLPTCRGSVFDAILHGDPHHSFKQSLERAAKGNSDSCKQNSTTSSVALHS